MWKKLAKGLAYPPFPILIALLPLAITLLVYAMVRAESTAPIAIAAYALSAYTLTVFCLRIPDLIRAFGRFRRENRFVRRWREDERLRIGLSLYGSLAWNGLYAALWLLLGLRHGSFWYYSLAGYSLSLGVIRFSLLRYTRRHKAGEHLRRELRRYRACGWVLLFMTAALLLMLFFMVYWGRTFLHGKITAISMAAATFTSLTLAILGILRYRHHESPVYAAAKTVSLAAALVSLLTLESTMLNTFSGGAMDKTAERLMLGISGGVAIALILVTAILMIVNGTKRIQELAIKEKQDGQ